MAVIEKYRTERGETVKRVKSSVYYWIGLACFALGIYLIYSKVLFGAFLVLTAFPFFFLYPLVRFLFGGKDSIGAALVTAVVEETLKSEIKKATSKKERRK